MAAGLTEALAAAVPGLRTSASGPDRIAYARDLWPRHHLEVAAGRIAEHRPALVAWPRDVTEVAAVVRHCAEEGIPLVRVANNGISAMFDPYGRELARIDLDVAGVADTALPVALSPPPYARYGDGTALLLWLVVLVCWRRPQRWLHHVRKFARM